MTYQQIIETWGEIARAASEKWGLRQSLILADIRQESSGDPSAVSHCGAVGLMQIMPIALKDFNRLYGAEIPFEYMTQAAVNVDVGTGFLKYLITRFDGDERLGLQAYNQGYSRVRRDPTAGTWYADGVLKHDAEFTALLSA